MDIVEIQHTLGSIVAGLQLLRNNMMAVNSSELKNLSDYLSANQLHFEQALRVDVKDRASDYYIRQLYFTLETYIEWYATNYHSERIDNENTIIAKQIYDRIIFLWLPPIENIFPNIAKSCVSVNNIVCDNKDPKGYNKRYEMAGEHYRSIRYDIVENPDYPHLSSDEIYNRLKSIIYPVRGEGVKIGMILNIAIKHRLLLKKPQGKSLEREMGMTCSYPAVVNVIDTPSGYFDIDDWGKEMEAKLLK